MRIIHFSDFHFQPNTGILKSQRLTERQFGAPSARCVRTFWN